MPELYIPVDGTTPPFRGSVGLAGKGGTGISELLMERVGNAEASVVMLAYSVTVAEPEVVAFL